MNFFKLLSFLIIIAVFASCTKSEPLQPDPDTSINSFTPVTSGSDGQTSERSAPDDDCFCKLVLEDQNILGEDQWSIKNYEVGTLPGIDNEFSKISGDDEFYQVTSPFFFGTIPSGDYEPLDLDPQNGQTTQTHLLELQDETANNQFKFFRTYPKTNVSIYTKFVVQLI